MGRLLTPRRTWSLREITEWLFDFSLRDIRGIVDWTPTVVGAGACVDFALPAATYPACTGLRAGYHAVSVTPPPTIQAGLVVMGFVANDDELTVRIFNSTGAGIVPAAGDWTFFGVIA